MTDKPTLEEINERLRSIGVEPNTGWDENEERKVPHFLSEVRELGGLLSDTLEYQIESDKKTVAELRETLARLQHGGGS